MLPETLNILYAVVAILAGGLVYFACKAWFWRQEALFNWKMWKHEEQYTNELFSQLCQLAERVRYDGEKQPEGDQAFLARQEDVDAVMEAYPEEAAPNPDILILHKGDTNGTGT